MEGKKALCICASNRKNSGDASWCICKMIARTFEKKNICAKVVDLQEIFLTSCVGCGGCYDKGRCATDENFNQLFEKIEEADYLFFVSPHHAPIPARLCMLLEKLVQLAAPHRQKEPFCRLKHCGKLAGIISYGVGGEQMLMHCKAMVNDTIADALGDARLKVVPFNFEWNTGISIPVTESSQGDESCSETVFSMENDFEQTKEKVEMYVEIVVQTSRTLYAIL